jgi:hypothetical protein
LIAVRDEIEPDRTEAGLLTVLGFAVAFALTVAA